MKISMMHVTKKMKGKTVLADVSADFESGRIYGLVGENGSGKTMLLRAISGLIKIDRGDIVYEGIRSNGKNKDIGLMIENMGLYPELNAYENLKYLTGLNKRVSDETIYQYIEKVGLDPKDKRAFKKYSLGMKQRLVFAQAIYEDPSIVLLDEPTNALDGNGVELIQNLIKEMKSEERILVFASHNKEFVEALADQIYTMREGRLER